MANPGRVITSEVIASLVGETWAHSITPVNILRGFKKSGISPNEVSDRMLAAAISVQCFPFVGPEREAGSHAIISIDTFACRERDCYNVTSVCHEGM